MMISAFVKIVKSRAAVVRGATVAEDLARMKETLVRMDDGIIVALNSGLDLLAGGWVASCTPSTLIVRENMGCFLRLIVRENISSMVILLMVFEL